MVRVHPGHPEYDCVRVPAKWQKQVGNPCTSRGYLLDKIREQKVRRKKREKRRAEREKEDLQEILEISGSLLRVTFLTRQKKMLVVDVYTVNTTKDRTKQVLNTTGMRQKKMLVIRIGQIDG